MQNYDNNPNHERQLPREHDSESADCSDTESEKKPTEKPNQTRGNQKRNCEIHKHRQNKHFLFSLSGFVSVSLHLMYVL